MASIYVSYRSNEKGFVQDVISRLEPRHEVHVDYKMPVGADWRSHQLEELRTSEVFLVFVSRDTRASDFQNSEMGAARFCSTFLDSKLIIPALIDDIDCPRPLAHLGALDLRNRDADEAARKIEAAIITRTRRVRLFVSHAHRDADLASRLVDVITAGLDVPAGQLRCTSVAGYQLDLGAMAPDALRRELGSAACVIAVLTPNSLGNDWVLFEIGAAWANAKVSIPLLAGGLQDKDIPGPFRGVAGGQLTNPATLDRMMDQLEKVLGWQPRSGAATRGKRYEMVEFVKAKTFISSDDTRLTFLSGGMIFVGLMLRNRAHSLEELGDPFRWFQEHTSRLPPAGKRELAYASKAVKYACQCLEALGIVNSSAGNEYQLTQQGKGLLDSAHMKQRFSNVYEAHANLPRASKRK